MNPVSVRFPSARQWERIYRGSALPRIFSLLEDNHSRNPTRVGVRAFAEAIESANLLLEIRDRTYAASVSYVISLFYYNKGIPDARWYVSPGRNGESVQYFPDFKNKHFRIKTWFDYYADVFYYKLFSALDLVGHLLDLRYNLGIHKVDFGKAVRGLSSQNPVLHAGLSETTESAVFKTASRIRNDITHNYLPHTVGMVATITRAAGTETTSFGLKQYLPSRDIVANMNDVLNCYESVLENLAR